MENVAGLTLGDAQVEASWEWSEAALERAYEEASWEWSEAALERALDWEFEGLDDAGFDEYARARIEDASPYGLLSRLQEAGPLVPGVRALLGVRVSG